MSYEDNMYGEVHFDVIVNEDIGKGVKRDSYLEGCFSAFFKKKYEKIINGFFDYEYVDVNIRQIIPVDEKPTEFSEDDLYKFEKSLKYTLYITTPNMGEEDFALKVFGLVCRIKELGYNPYIMIANTSGEGTIHIKNIYNIQTENDIIQY